VPKLTRTQWINLLASIPAAFSLGTTVVCILILLLFGSIAGGTFVFAGALVVLFFATYILVRCMMGRYKCQSSTSTKQP
jgi:hypothetical protein